MIYYPSEQNQPSAKYPGNNPESYVQLKTNLFWMHLVKNILFIGWIDHSLTYFELLEIQVKIWSQASNFPQMPWYGLFYFGNLIMSPTFSTFGD